MRGLTDRAEALLDRHLLKGSRRPLAVAVSGGGDSVALALIAEGWARRSRRDLLLLTLDHGLNPDSAAWTGRCEALAQRLGRPFRALAWTGPKPASGLPAAARAARHRLLAEAAREAGARVILMGHTADDVAEAQVMRAAGATTPEPRVWAPSPAWPEGRGVFVLRPLLDVRRAELRDWLSARGETWIEDPANADPRFARARARRALPADTPLERQEPAPAAIPFEERLGVLDVARAAFRASPAGLAERWLAMACVCAGGGSRRPPGVRAARLSAALRGDGPVLATLAGARIEADAIAIRIFREAGEAARGGLAALSLPRSQAVVWDGRFELLAPRPGLEVRRLAGLASRLPDAERRRLQAVPGAARGALPAVVDGERVSCPLLSDTPAVQVRGLVADRLRAAAGLVTREPD